MKGIIYKIECNETGDVYFGSTIKTLAQRISLHKSEAKAEKKKCKSYDIIRRGNYSYSLVETIECQDIEQIREKEKYYIQNFECVNKCIPNRTEEEIKEYRKQYRDANKERKKEKMKEYYEKNKERKKEQMKEYREANKDKIKEYYQKNKEKYEERYQKKKANSIKIIIDL